MTDLSPDTTPSVKHPAETVPKAGLGHLAPKNGIVSGLALTCWSCHRLFVPSIMDPMANCLCPECRKQATDKLNSAKWREVEGE